MKKSSSKFVGECTTADQKAIVGYEWQETVKVSDFWY